MISPTQLQTQITIFIILWFITATLILRRSLKKKGVSSGFTLIYIVNVSLIHFISALLYLLPWHKYINGEWMLSGFREATIGMLSFGLGNLILSPLFLRLFHISHLDSNELDKISGMAKSKLPEKYFLIGVIAYFILPSFIGDVPTINALVGASQQLMIIGICLNCWRAWCEKDQKKLRNWLIISLSLPFVTIIKYGFLGMGTMMFLTILIFTTRFFRIRLKSLIFGLVLAYLGLSLYQTYMRDRERLRATIWEEAPITDRITSLKGTLSNPEWFNPFNLEHLERIDGRMNQNILVGAAVEYLNSGAIDYACGQTFWNACLALVPRIFWRDKPVHAGGKEIPSRYTGIMFSEDVSVAVGQVMEFYINFGRVGVIIGFLILGILVGIIDTMSGYYLAKGNLQRFVLWFLPGTALLLAEGSLVEVVGTWGSALVVAFLLSSRYVNLLFGLLILYLIIEAVRRNILR